MRSLKSLRGRKSLLEECGVLSEVLRNYGTKEDKDHYCGLTDENILQKLHGFISIEA